MSLRSTVYIVKEENWFVANSIETGVASQGKTIDEAITNLKEALELYFEDNKPKDNFKQSYITSLEVSV